jgi:hypothetical protein
MLLHPVLVQYIAPASTALCIAGVLSMAQLATTTVDAKRPEASAYGRPSCCVASIYCMHDICAPAAA